MFGGDGCRFGWCPKILAFFISSGLALSIASSLNCKFLEVILDFTSDEYPRGEVGFGLWSFEHPDGHCVSYYEAYDTGGLGMGYSKWFMNNDLSWTTSRILAMASVFFGIVAFISAWFSACKKEPYCVDMLAYTTIITFLSEGSKFGLFFDVKFCTSNLWYNEVSEEMDAAKSCNLSHGSFMGIGSMAAYFVSMIMAAGYLARPKEFSGDEDYDYEENSLPSWMQESVAPSFSPEAAYKAKVHRDNMLAQQGTESTRQSFYDNDMSEDSYRDIAMSTNVFPQELLEDDEFALPPMPRTRGGPPRTMPRRNSQAARNMEDLSVVTWDP